MSNFEIPSDFVSRVGASLFGGTLPEDWVSVIALPAVAFAKKLAGGSKTARVVAATRWATAAWAAWFRSLVCRNDSSKPIVASPAEECSVFLGRLFLEDSLLAVKYVKEQTCYLAGVILGQGPEDLPTFSVDMAARGLRPGILAGGWVYEVCRSLMRHPLSAEMSPHEQRQAVAAAADILLSKTGRAAVPAEFVEKTVREYLKDMTRRHTEPDPIILAMIEDRISEVVEKVFKGTVFRPSDQIPSLNASFEAKRTWGGCFGRLLEGWALLYLDRVVMTRDGPMYKAPQSDTLSPLREHPVYRLFTGSVGEKMEKLGFTLDEWDSNDHPVQPRSSSNTRTTFDVLAPGEPPRSVTLPTPGVDYYASFQRYVDDLIKASLTDPSKFAAGLAGHIDVKTFPIIEPDKVRVITLSEAAFTLRCLELQKFVHSTLKRFAPFEYIGQPIDDPSWNRHFGDALPEDWVYLSGDYKNATNNLNPDLSSHVWDCICRQVKLDPELNPDETDSPLFGGIWHVLGRADLVRHRFTIPEEPVGKDKFVPDHTAQQLWGQLMGSATSFPVLCVINFAVSSLALGLSVKASFLPTTPLVVNGDDIAAAMPREALPMWKLLTAQSGLEFSLGKNYVSRHFCVMNSEFRTAVNHSGRPGMTSWSFVGGVNQALLRGFEKKGIEAGVDLKPGMRWTELGARARELVAGIPEVAARRLTSIFCDYHAEVLALVPPGVSFVAAEYLGGVGLPFGSTPTIDNRKFHTAVACLDLKARQKLLRPPPRWKYQSPLDSWLSESALFYAKRFGSHIEERPSMDVLLENWGFPIQREKSDIGARLRLCFVLHKFVEYYYGLGSLIERLRQLDHDDEGSDDHRSIGFSIPLSTFPSMFRAATVSFGQRLNKFARSAKGRVLDWELTADDAAHGYTGTDRLHLISLERLTSWAPPVEEIVNWPSEQLRVLTRFRQTVTRGHDSRTLYGDFRPKTVEHLHHWTSRLAVPSDRERLAITRPAPSLGHVEPLLSEFSYPPLTVGDLRFMLMAQFCQNGTAWGDETPGPLATVSELALKSPHRFLAGAPNDAVVLRDARGQLVLNRVFAAAGDPRRPPVGDPRRPPGFMALSSLSPTRIVRSGTPVL